MTIPQGMNGDVTGVASRTAEMRAYHINDTIACNSCCRRKTSTSLGQRTVGRPRSRRSRFQALKKMFHRNSSEFSSALQSITCIKCYKTNYVTQKTK